MADLKVRTNVTPKKKKKPETSSKPDPGKVRPFVVTGTGKHELKHERGKITKTYTAKREFTGHPEYGKDNPNKPDPKFIEEARSKKKDIAYDKDGKPYRAGVTTTKHDPDKISGTHHKIKIVRPKETVQVKPKKSTEEIRQQSDKPPVRKMERVKYLRAKDAKGGISNERNRPKKRSGY